MAFKPRWYQRNGSRKIIESVLDGKHPIGVFPTGSGKTIVLCILTEKYLDIKITKDVLILSHRSKILEQDFNALENYFPDIEIGLYSHGLNSKTKCKITVAGIQSVFRKPELFKNTGLVIIDEAHLISHKNIGMYRTFLEALPDAQFAGITATHFRLGHGYIHKGEDVLFNELAYDLSSTENYNKLVAQRYLSKMFSYKTKLEMKVDDIGMLGGDFKSKDLSKKFDRKEITELACVEISRAMAKHSSKKCLIFAIDTEHAEHINDYMNTLGHKSVAIHSKKKDNDYDLRRFESGKYDVAVGVEMLTTGLDIPSIDMIGLLRPTDSPSLHVQMIGRGGRVYFVGDHNISTLKGRINAIKQGGKKYCMILDFAGNISRLGPINSVHVKEVKKRKGGGTGGAIMKTCPKCNVETFAAVRICGFCGHHFEFKIKLKAQSDGTEVIAKKENKVEKKNRTVTSTGNWIDVVHVTYSIHEKPGKPSSMKVSYQCTGQNFAEYICIDHGFYSRQKAKLWIKARMPLNVPKPKSLRELFSAKSALMVPKKIFVAFEGGWNVIKQAEF